MNRSAKEDFNLRLAMSPGLSAWLAERIAAYPAESAPQLRWLAEYAARAGALPLYPGWVETIGLRPDGEVVSWSTEGEYPGTKPVEDRYLWLTSLVFAAKRYPELRSLLPERTANALGYAVFVLLCDAWIARVGVLRTFGQNPLIAYLLDGSLGGLVSDFWPEGGGLSWALAGAAVRFALTYLPVRLLEWRRIYLRL
jgi:hypothetical protein